jgi:hypothetical protein
MSAFDMPLPQGRRGGRAYEGCLRAWWTGLNTLKCSEILRPNALPRYPIPAEDMLAHRLLASSTGIELALLEFLLGEPKARGEVRQHFRKLRSREVDATIERLGVGGLLRRSVSRGGESSYGVTSLGVAVVLKAHEFLPLEARLDAARRAGMFAR